MSNPQILSLGTANPPSRFTQQQCFEATGYKGERIRKIFLNSDIEFRHFYFEGSPNLDEDSDQRNQRYLNGAVKTGCRAIANCLDSANAAVHDVDFLAVCTCTGYVCPDVGRPLTERQRLTVNVLRDSIVGLGCAGVIPAMQGAVD